MVGLTAKTVSGLSAITIFAQAMPAVEGPLGQIERLGLVGALACAVIALWRALNREKAARDSLLAESTKTNTLVLQAVIEVRAALDKIHDDERRHK